MVTTTTIIGTIVVEVLNTAKLKVTVKIVKVVITIAELEIASKLD